MKKYVSSLALIMFCTVAVNAQTDVNTTVTQDVFHDFTNSSSGQRSAVDFHYKDATQGSAYLFDKWVKGSVVNNNDSVVSNPSFLFNYNKMRGALLVTQDQKTYIELDRGSIKSFTLEDAFGANHTYAKQTIDDKTVFAEVLAKGTKYAAFKVTKTKFKKADYHTDGLVETGNNYDEYIDECEYYFANLKSKAPADKFSMKKKSIKEIFGVEGTKVDTFFSQHSSDKIDEAFVENLVDYLNQ